ncbi:MAG: 4-hydroxy-3-methylbut-2-en-1-yl diphosphate synthase [Elusimicrobia bacterium RIFOXYA2_FULL_39_19]|nr:MAG: 4-hydroxy-3-methylbut-2-en-1-yl diphosphate synthase [Elusimicrobia bacterium RIFOXYA2_FULL_39_19]
MNSSRKTRKIKVGNVCIGGNAPVTVQSMTNTDTKDIHSTVNQIKNLEKAGCEIVRTAVPDMEAAKALSKIKKQINIPLVADIHFDYKLALESIYQGADKIRINPGNIGSSEKTKQVVLAAKAAKIPIRIGINSGSIKPSIKNPGLTLTDNMVYTALEYIKMFEDWDFQDIVISLKSSDVLTTIDSYRKLSKKTLYPLHLGITESGPPGIGTVKSTLGIGILLYEGIGDTIRVSLTGDPVEEVKVAFGLLQTLNLRNYGVDLISCPTCARCRNNLNSVVTSFEKEIAPYRGALSRRKAPLKVAIMGCEVNGPGEAKHADIGIAGGRNTGLLFKNGKPFKKAVPGKWVKELIREIKKDYIRNK